MTFPTVTASDWRAQVEKDLAGKPFDKALVHLTLEGLAVAPLYTEATALPRVLGDGAPFRICMRHGAGASEAEILADIEGGADALWLPKAEASALPESLPPDVLTLVDEDERSTLVGGKPWWLASTLDFHARGADACDEVALALTAVVERLAGEPRPILVRVAAGRDTFIELCKVRALRIGLRKVLAAAGEPTPAFSIHAVASPRTMAARDPWVNMLRVTTEVFAAVLGGADIVTPLPFDEALSSSSALGRRVARNTGHVLREESALGRVIDPGAGSYYLDALTDAIAREAWERFRAIEREGGLGKAIASGHVGARLAAAAKKRRDAFATRKLPVLGVSEFANLGESLPASPRADETILRDGADFEALRTRAEALPPEAREVALVTLGPASEARARVGFASAFFATAGLRARELGEGEAVTPGAAVCICGTDERYATEAAAKARELHERGARHILLAGRPGALEKELRAAGVVSFIFLGSDAPSTLAQLLEVPS